MDICALDATALSAAIAKQELSPVDIVHACFERIGVWNETLRAFVYLNEEKALADARALAEEIAKSGPRSPLHGIPVGYKDVVDVAGMPTTAGSRLLRDNAPAMRDSSVAARLRAAGTIALGKLNTFEFATGGQETFGETRNPWNLSYATGGSSTGPAAALAGRLVPLAIGTDTGGSVRIPASFCGLVALRATRGAIDKTGVVPLSPTLDEVGPMARSVSDCALLFEAMSGRALEKIDVNVQGVKLGVPERLWGECDPEVEVCMNAAIAELHKLGAKVYAVNLPSAVYGTAASWAISYHETFLEHREQLLNRSTDYTPLFYNKISSAGTLTPEELSAAQQIAGRIADEFKAALAQVDAIVLPATPKAAYPLGGQQAQADSGAFTRPVSLAGLPGLTLPWGFARNGLPLGMQLVGRAGDEARLFAIAAKYESSTSWHSATPPMACSPITTSIESIRRALWEEGSVPTRL
jgi:aspartyl-tRNA(Asn)/glutamyl-tRNA(Gln) amidotransferase subunit A